MEEECNARLMILLCEKIVVKLKEMKAGWSDSDKSCKEGCGLERAVLLKVVVDVMVMMMMMRRRRRRRGGGGRGGEGGRVQCQKPCCFK
jgi:hypothetical protein